MLLRVLTVLARFGHTKPSVKSAGVLQQGISSSRELQVILDFFARVLQENIDAFI